MGNPPTDGKVSYSPKAYIIHDTQGNIISVGRVPLNTRGRVEIRPRNQAHSVLEIELNAKQDAMTCWICIRRTECTSNRRSWSRSERDWNAN